MRGGFESSVHHLPTQRIIVRVDASLKCTDKMNMSILQELIPFTKVSTIVLDRDDTFMPVTDTRAISE